VTPAGTLRARPITLGTNPRRRIPERQRLAQGRFAPGSRDDPATAWGPRPQSGTERVCAGSQVHRPLLCPPISLLAAGMSSATPSTLRRRTLLRTSLRSSRGRS
jgi:hypothetical protein